MPERHISRQLPEANALLGGRHGTPRTKTGNEVRGLERAVRQDTNQPRGAGDFAGGNRAQPDNLRASTELQIGHDLVTESGRRRRNRTLVGARAEAFCQMVRDAGVPASRLIEADHPPHTGGLISTKESDTVFGRALNRRAELFITHTPTVGAETRAREEKATPETE